MGAKKDCCSNILGAKQDFWSNKFSSTILNAARILFKQWVQSKAFVQKILGVMKYFCTNNLGAKQDICSNILGVKQVFCSKILDVKEDFSSNIVGAKQDF